MTPCDFASLKGKGDWCKPRRLETPKTSRLVAHHVYRDMGDGDYFCVMCQRQRGDRYERP